VTKFVKRLVICLFCCLLAVPVFSQKSQKYSKYIMTEKLPDVHIFEDPKPTCEEKVYVELKKVGEVPEDINAPAFLVKPWSIVADDDGNVFVMDIMFLKIYKYDKNLQFVKSFGNKGEGPAEFKGGLGGGSALVELHLGRDNLIYAGDRGSRKIICFDRDGNLVKEFKMNVPAFSRINPVLDNAGNFYIHSNNNKYVIDIFDQSGNLKSSLLPIDVLAKGLFYKLKEPLNILWMYGKSDSGTVDFQVWHDGRLLVLSKSSGIIYVLKQGKFEKELRLWPKQMLIGYKKSLKWLMGEGDDSIEAFRSIYENIILDWDNPKYFYLSHGIPRGERKNYLYQFDVNGGLHKVLYLIEPFEKSFTSIKYKKNGIFYATGSDSDFNKTLMIFREEVKK